MNTCAFCGWRDAAHRTIDEDSGGMRWICDCCNAEVPDPEEPPVRQRRRPGAQRQRDAAARALERGECIHCLCRPISAVSKTRCTVCIARHLQYERARARMRSEAMGRVRQA